MQQSKSEIEAEVKQSKVWIDANMPDWIKQQSLVLEARSFGSDGTIAVDYENLFEFELMHYEVIETAIADDELTCLMGIVIKLSAGRPTMPS